jgi:hypothetical protein
MPFLQENQRRKMIHLVSLGAQPSGNFTIRHKTLSEIAAELKNGNALHEYGLDIAITAQIKGFEKAGSLVKLSRIQT